MVNIYFAAPLFNEMEQNFNQQVVDKLREELDTYDVNIYLPQENDEINDKSNYADSLIIYDGDTAHLKETDILIAVLDGQTTDIGVATEVGYFARLAEELPDIKRIVGLYSDTRQGNVTDEKVDALRRVGESQWSYLNLYLGGAIKSHGEMVQSSEELVGAVKRAIEYIGK